MNKKQTALGIGENIEGALCYVLGWITGILFLVLEKENKFIRFHAMQSLVVFLFLFVINIFIGWVPIIGWLIALLTIPVGFILWILLIIKAFQGKLYKLPFAGKFAEEQIFGEEIEQNNDEK